MTRALDAAMAELSKLSDADQDRVAEWLMAELRDEERWAEQFAGSQGALSALAAEARSAASRGEATEIDPEQL